MACSLSQHIQILWVRSPQTNSPSKSQKIIRRNRNSSCRLRTLKSSPPRNSSTPLQSSSEKSNSKPTLAPPNREDVPCSNSTSGFSLFDSFSIRLTRLRYALISLMYWKCYIMLLRTFFFFLNFFFFLGIGVRFNLMQSNMTWVLI